MTFEDQLTNGPLEKRRFVCPECKKQATYHIYSKDEPLFIHCPACFGVFVWHHKNQTLWSAYRQEGAEWKQYDSENFFVFS